MIATLVALGAPGSAFAFGGASLSNPGETIAPTHGGVLYPRLSCPGGTYGFCTGTISISTGGRKLASAPIALRGNDSPSVDVRLSRAAFSLIQRSGRLRTRVTIKTHDTNGAWATTVDRLYIRPA